MLFRQSFLKSWATHDLKLESNKQEFNIPFFYKTLYPIYKLNSVLKNPISELIILRFFFSMLETIWGTVTGIKYLKSENLKKKRVSLLVSVFLKVRTKEGDRMYLYIIKRTLRVDSADMIHPVSQWGKKKKKKDKLLLCLQTF